MAKFLMLSGGGDGLGLALRLKEEGHDISVWIRDARARDDYNGLLKKVDNTWGKTLTKDTTVIFDSTGGGRVADRLRAEGYSVLGGSEFADQLEMDRGVAFGIMEEVGIKVPHSETFTSFPAGKKFVQQSEKRLAFKPTGEMGPEVTTYVSYDKEDLLEMLDYFEAHAKGEIEFELQEVVEGGLLISTEGWFNGQRFVAPFNHTFERKQLMNDNLGPSGGCARNVVFAVEGSNFIADEGLRRMEPILAHNEYVGPIDLNTVVNNEGVWALEFTPRFGYDALPTFLELLNEPIGDLLNKFATGKGSDIKLKQGIGGSVRVTIPPYPNEKFRPAEGIPIRGLVRSDRLHLYLYNVALNNQNKLISTKGFGVIGAFTGLGMTIEESLQGPYSIANKSRIPNRQFRTDLSEVFEDDFRKFNELISSKRNELPSPQEVT